MPQGGAKDACFTLRVFVATCETLLTEYQKDQRAE